jgi:hypothetical protein
MSRIVIKKQKEKSKQAAMPMSRELLGEQSGASPAEITPADVRQLIANRAYELYAERGYREGHALDDWLESEREILGHRSPL